ncbi:MAG: OmpA family protein [Paludibaculum sp.]
MKSRYRLTIWVAFADFFVALSLISFGYFANQVNEGTRVSRTLAAEKAARQACEEKLIPVTVKDAKGNAIPVQTALLKLAEQIQRDLQAQGLAVEVNPNTASVELSENFIQFPSGQFAIAGSSPQEFRLKTVARCLLAHRDKWLRNFVLSIQGHTDAIPLLGQGDSNLDLSRRRAREVERVLAENGIRAPDFMVVSQGMGEFYPKAFSDCTVPDSMGLRCSDRRVVTARDVAANRRIELRFGLFTGN